MKDKVVVITGASDGIGAEAARSLSAQGAHVVVVGRSEQKTVSIARELNAPYYLADFASLDQVRLLASSLRRDYDRIDVLINNAGGMLKERELTADGHEKTFQVNYLAHFLLTHSLLDILVRSSASVINTTSLSHYLGKARLHDLNLERGYSAFKAYASTKLYLILLAHELHRRFNGQGLSTAAADPGIVASNFGGEAAWLIRFAYHTRLGSMVGFVTPQKGAEALTRLASTEPGEDWKSGEYYFGRRVMRASRKACDPNLAQALWEKSEELVEE